MSSFLAIDADAQGLYVASGTVRKGAVTIDRAVALPDEAIALNAESAVSLGEKLKDLLKKASIAAAPAILLVGRDKLFLKEVKHPPVPGSEEPAVVKFQATKELSENPDDMVLDYLPTGETPDGGRKSMAVFIRKDYLQAAKDFCNAAGIKLVAVTPRPYAAVSSLRAAFKAGTEPPETPSDAVGMVYLAGQGAEFAVLRGEELLFSRSIPAGAMQSEASFVSEMRRNLAVVNGQVPGGINAVYLAEADSPGGGWAGRLQASLPIAVRTFDPLAGSAAANAVPPQYRGQFASLAGAINLKSIAGPLPINFITPRQPKAEPNKNRSKFLYAALAACVLLALGFAGGMWLVESANKEYSTLNDEKTQVEEDLQKLLTNAKRSEAADEFMKHQLRLHDELYDWTDLFPDIKDTRVTIIDYNANPLPDKKARADEEKKKEQNPTTYKAPVRPVGSVTFTIQAKDRAVVETFVKTLSQQKNYVSVSAPQGGTNSTFTVKAGIHYRKADQYTRKLNVVMPKAKPKASGFDDEFGGPVGNMGFSAPIGGGELP